MESISPTFLYKATWTEKEEQKEDCFGGQTPPLHLVRDMAIANNKTALHLACPQIHVPYKVPKHRMGEPNSLENWILTGMVPKS